MLRLVLFIILTLVPSRFKSMTLDPNGYIAYVKELFFFCICYFLANIKKGNMQMQYSYFKIHVSRFCLNAILMRIFNR